MANVENSGLREQTVNLAQVKELRQQHRHKGLLEGPRLFMLECFFVGNSKLLSAFSPAGSQYSPAVSRGHSLAESVLVFSLSLRRLKGAYHGNRFKTLKMRAAKMGRILTISKWPQQNR